MPAAAAAMPASVGNDSATGSAAGCGTCGSRSRATYSAPLAERHVLRVDALEAAQQRIGGHGDDAVAVRGSSANRRVEEQAAP